MKSSVRRPHSGPRPPRATAACPSPASTATTCTTRCSARATRCSAWAAGARSATTTTITWRAASPTATRSSCSTTAASATPATTWACPPRWNCTPTTRSACSITWASSNVHLMGLVGMGACVCQEIAIRRPDLARSMLNMGAWCEVDDFLRDQLEMFRWIHRDLGFLPFQKAVTLLSFDAEYYNANKAAAARTARRLEGTQRPLCGAFAPDRRLRRVRLEGPAAADPLPVADHPRGQGRGDRAAQHAADRAGHSRRQGHPVGRCRARRRRQGAEDPLRQHAVRLARGELTRVRMAPHLQSLDRPRLAGAGIALGAWIDHSGGEPAHALASGIEAIGTLWLNALRMTVGPLVFAMLVSAVASVSDAMATGRLAHARHRLVRACCCSWRACWRSLLTQGLLALWPVDRATADAFIAGRRPGRHGAVHEHRLVGLAAAAAAAEHHRRGGGQRDPGARGVRDPVRLRRHEPARATAQRC